MYPTPRLNLRYSLNHSKVLSQKNLFIRKELFISFFFSWGNTTDLGHSVVQLKTTFKQLERLLRMSSAFRRCAKISQCNSKVALKRLYFLAFFFVCFADASQLNFKTCLPFSTTSVQCFHWETIWYTNSWWLKNTYKLCNKVYSTAGINKQHC